MDKDDEEIKFRDQCALQIAQAIIVANRNLISYSTGFDMKNIITFEDFQKLDIRVGTIIQADIVPKSKKLLRLAVDFGHELGVRTIMAGIAGGDASSAAVNLTVGKPRVLAIVNLVPREMMGVQSHGMLLACHDGLNNIVLTTVASAVPNGVEVG